PRRGSAAMPRLPAGRPPDPCGARPGAAVRTAPPPAARAYRPARAPRRTGAESRRDGDDDGATTIQAPTVRPAARRPAATSPAPVATTMARRLHAHPSTGPTADSRGPPRRAAFQQRQPGV